MNILLIGLMSVVPQSDHLSSLLYTSCVKLIQHLSGHAQNVMAAESTTAGNREVRSMGMGIVTSSLIPVQLWAVGKNINFVVSISPTIVEPLILCSTIRSPGTVYQEIS